jgi:hypothetical protein
MANDMYFLIPALLLVVIIATFSVSSRVTALVNFPHPQVSVVASALVLQLGHHVPTRRGI